MVQNELLINGKDAYATYGIVMSTTTLSELMKPAPQKERISSRSRLRDGASYSTSHEKVNERQVTLNIQMIATTEAEFLTNYQKFCTDVLETGIVDIMTRFQQQTLPNNTVTNVEYHMLYEDCTSYSEFHRGIAKYTLKLVEPDPTDRTPRERD